MSITSKPSTKAYSDGWDRIFGKKAEPTRPSEPVKPVIPKEDPAVVERTAQTAEWWKFCEDNQLRLKHIPKFEQWRAGGPYDWIEDEGSTLD